MDGCLPTVAVSCLPQQNGQPDHQQLGYLDLWLFGDLMKSTEDSDFRNV